MTQISHFKITICPFERQYVRLNEDQLHLSQIPSCKNRLEVCGRDRILFPYLDVKVLHHVFPLRASHLVTSM